VRYARQTLWVLGRFRADRHGLRWPLLRRPAAWAAERDRSEA
jgi:hypothetical protein